MKYLIRKYGSSVEQINTIPRTLKDKSRIQKDNQRKEKDNPTAITPLQKVKPMIDNDNPKII